MKKAAPAPAPGASGSSGEQAPEGVSVTTAAAPVNDNMVYEGEAEASTPNEFIYESDTNPDDDE